MLCVRKILTIFELTLSKNLSNFTLFFLTQVIGEARDKLAKNRASSTKPVFSTQVVWLMRSGREVNSPLDSVVWISFFIDRKNISTEPPCNRLLYLWLLLLLKWLSFVNTRLTNLDNKPNAETVHQVVTISYLTMKASFLKIFLFYSKPCSV